MIAKASAEEITAAKAYENLHVPALFQQFAPRVTEAVDLHPQQRVLDVACGTGILTRHCQSIIGEDSFIEGLDTNAGMLTVANQLAPSIEWKQGRAESLPYADESFDVVVSQFGLMFFKDRLAAIREMLRVLVPEGRLAVAVWDSLENSGAYALEVNLLTQLAGKQAADALRAPFVLGNRDELEMLFQNAGVESISVKTHQGTARFPNIRTMVEADLRGWLPVMGVNLSETLIETILKEAEQTLSQYLAKDGSMQFITPAHIVSGMKNILQSSLSLTTQKD